MLLIGALKGPKIATIDACNYHVNINIFNDKCLMLPNNEIE